MTLKVAINGYGRIGRGVHRQLLKTPGIDVVAINSRAGADSHAYLLKYDSLYGRCDADIKVVGDDLEIDGKKVKVLSVKNPAEIGWKDLDIDLVIESTGKFTTRADANGHLEAGAKKVLITAPCKDLAIPNIVMGVNDKDYSPEDYEVVSNASCTTNCLAPVMKVLNDELGVVHAFVNTIHAFTYTQNLLDNSNPQDFRRARATTESVIPTSTGAMKAIGRVIPELDGKLEGMAYRVPIPVVSSIDVVANVEKSVTADEVNEIFKKRENSDLKGVLATEDEPLVSVDFRGDTHSATVDLENTRVLGDKMVKVLAWYDNEWGYISRVVDLIKWFML